MEDRRVGVRIVTRKKKRQRRKASINQIPEATKKGKATVTMMRMMFHQYSKGRVLFTSSPSARVRVVQEDRPEWLLTRTTTTMTMMCSRRL